MPLPSTHHIRLYYTPLCTIEFLWGVQLGSKMKALPFTGIQIAATSVCPVGPPCLRYSNGGQSGCLRNMRPAGTTLQAKERFPIRERRLRLENCIVDRALFETPLVPTPGPALCLQKVVLFVLLYQIKCPAMTSMFLHPQPFLVLQGLQPPHIGESYPSISSSIHLIVKYRQRKSHVSSGSNIAESRESTLEPLRPY